MKCIPCIAALSLVVCAAWGALSVADVTSSQPGSSETAPEEQQAATSAPEKPAAETEDPDKVDWSKVNWRKRLTRHQYYITRQAGTERAFRNKYWNNKQEGLYRCVCCELPLFESETKFKSGTGWPSFYAPVDAEAVSEHEDRKLFYVRTEIRCSRCDAHLGHVFGDGPAPTGLRYCMNSAALKFEERKPEAAEQAPADEPAENTISESAAPAEDAE